MFKRMRQKAGSAPANPADLTMPDAHIIVVPLLIAITLYFTLRTLRG